LDNQYIAFIMLYKQIVFIY